MPQSHRRPLGPSLRSQWLAQSLKRLRGDNDLGIVEAADFLEVASSTMSRMENALVPIKRGDLTELLTFYNADERTRANLMELRDIAWRRDWWDGMVGVGQESSFADYAWLESRAETIRCFESEMVHGLFQTADYAEAIIRACEGPAVADEKIDPWVSLRMRRQEILDKDAAPKVTAILDESAFRRALGGPKVMKVQLHRLLAFNERPNVDIRVLPFSAVSHAGYCGSFTLFGLDDRYPDVAYAETAVTKMFVEDPEKLDRLEGVYADISRSALTPGESASFIADIAEGL
ncbi:helix-turn-helix transcriptional regulator [Phytomonospora sp. NPDC050363]|uniref:helix-turn-helix domain-containing protein n=1 Tax=Phytomonospora sp. NPDC050363 TaxID=3155642 RepID=UPI00340D6A86